MILWYNQKELAKFLGMSVNKFKDKYKNEFPPNRVEGTRIYWSANYAEKIAEKLTQHTEHTQ